MRWDRLISRWSFFPYILYVMDMLPSKDEVDLCHLLIVVGIRLTLINSSGLLWHRRR
jgi:hypothetical protein